METKNTNEYMAPADKQINYLLKLKDNKKFITICVIIALFILFVFGPVVLFIGLFIGLGISYVIYLSLKYYMAHRKFMREFAALNGFQFENSLDVNTLEARLFKAGHSRHASNAIFGKYKKYPIRIFNYTYYTGSGKNRRTHAFTSCEIEITKTKFPHIFLKSKSMSHYQWKDYFGKDKDNQITIVKEFSDIFKLFCTQDFEIEALQIFTPEILAMLSLGWPKLSIEFAGDKVYFYDDRTIRGQEDLDQLYAGAKKFLDDTGPLLERLHDDFDAMHQVYKS